MKKRVEIVENIFSANDRQAGENRKKLDNAKVFSINVMASPGAGKTSLIEHTIKELSAKMRVAVIDGDITTSLDADRAMAAGATALQINTGGECHLDAVMIADALQNIDLRKLDLLIVENVGNLVCPASFQLGTHKNVLVASVPEGDDKPYKYPGIYHGVQALLLNKMDLLPYVTFDLDYFYKGVEILNPGLITFPISCRTRVGLDQWFSWVREQVNKTKSVQDGII